MVMQTAEDAAVSRSAATGTSANASAPVADAERESRQWTIKGLDPSTIEVTRDAAKRSGMKLNSFVSQALTKAAADTGSKAIEPCVDDLGSADLQVIKSELAKIREQGQQLESTINSISAILLKLCAEKL